MGYQLWSSPVTGYRRVGTKISEIRELFEKGINLKSILEPLQCCIISDSAQNVKEGLIQRDFDVAGVLNENKNGVLGYIKREELKDGTIDKYVKSFQASNLISESTPLADLFKIFKDERFFFVLSGSDIKGIVTVADLNKPPARIYLFGIISLLEMHLTYWVKQFYDSNGISEELPEKRFSQAEDIFEDKKKKNNEISIIDCLQFCDKRDLVIGKKELREILDLPSKNKSEKKFKKAESLRNDLAHSQYDISGQIEWEDLFQIVRWVEDFLTNSDNIIEEKAKEDSDNFDNPLNKYG